MISADILEGRLKAALLDAAKRGLAIAVNGLSWMLERVLGALTRGD